MKNKLIIITKYLLAIVFIYAGAYKASDFSLFASQMYQSPLLPAALVPFIAIGLPVIEIIFGVFLIFSKKWEYQLLWISFGFMLFFSVYLLMLFTLYDKPPCACGGILSGMSYPVHIVFNIFFTVMPVIAILLHEEFKTKNIPV